MQVQKVIERLGYSPNEAKVYITALSMGECHVSDIASKLKLPRSSVQVIADQLHKDGLLNFYVRKRYKYWVAENPSRLLEKLREREDAVRAVMPQLESLRRGEGGKPQVKIFEGVDEIRLIYDDMLEAKQSILGIIPWDDWVRLLGRGFMEDFIEKRARRFLRIKLLTPKSPVTAGLRERDAAELRETHYLPAHIPVTTTTLIYGDKVAIVSLNKKLPTAVLIEDSDICETARVFFECMWGHSELA